MRNKNISASLATVTFLICSVAVAQAGGSLATPNIPSALTGVTSDLCQVTNVGNKPIEVVITIVASDLGIADNTSTVTIDPGHYANLLAPAANSNLYCRLTGASSKSARITFVALNGNTPVMTVTAP